MSKAAYRAADIERNLSIMKIRPLDVLVVGGTGSGKSSTLNSIFEAEIAKVGEGCDPETMHVSPHSLTDNFRLWDSPGLGDGAYPDKMHTKKLIDILYKSYDIDGQTYGLVDMVLVVIEGSTRDLGTVFQLLNEVVVPNFPKDRILVAVNQADVAMKGRHWDYNIHRPDTTLEAFLRDKARSIQDRVKEATGVEIAMPICYSANEGYNVLGLLDMIIDHMPRCRREFDRCA